MGSNCSYRKTSFGLFLVIPGLRNPISEISSHIDLFNVDVLENGFEGRTLGDGMLKGLIRELDLTVSS